MKPMTIQEIYDYAKLSTLAYVDLSEHGQNDITPEIIVEEGSKTENPGKSERIPEALGKQMFDPDTAADVTGRAGVRPRERVRPPLPSRARRPAEIACNESEFKRAA